MIGFGIFAGAGIGLGYAAATPPAVKWFSARKTGLIAGLVVAGFGLASVYISPLANHFTGYNLAGKPLPDMEELIQAKAKADGEFKTAQAALTAAKADPAQAARTPHDRTDPSPIRRPPAKAAGGSCSPSRSGTSTGPCFSSGSAS